MLHSIVSTIAFGLRNLENWAAALAEMSRVIKRERALARARVFTADNADLARILSFLFASLPAFVRFFSNRDEKRL